MDLSTPSNHISRRMYVHILLSSIIQTRRLTAVNPVAKTRTQLNRRLPDAQKLGWPPFGKAWYAGCTTLIIGNSLKAGIRTKLSAPGGLIHWAEGKQVSWHLTHTRLYCKMRRGLSQGHELSWQASELELQSLYSL